ncbi:MAG TPA: hypothetical protein VGM05_17565 [Planctomycetaceae bacterium]|jgi:hypothetical protein
MPKIAASKWLIAAAFAFWAAFAIETRAKQLAGNAAQAAANRTIGNSAPVDAKSLAQKSDLATTCSLVFASIALLCWAVSIYRREPASSLLVIIPALLYGMWLLLLV